MKNNTFKLLASLSLLAVITPLGVSAESLAGADKDASADTSTPLAKRPSLFGGKGSPKEALSEHGINLDLSYTRFGQGLYKGDTQHDFRSAGKVLAKLSIDGAKLGLWNGFSISVIGEYNDGNNQNGRAGMILPVNTVMKFPVESGSGGDMSMTMTQRFGEKTSLTLGKFNMVEAASRTPLVGGGGIDTFWYLNPAAPISGLVPPYVTGASLGVSTSLAQLSLMVFDPRGSQRVSGLDGWGDEGHTERLSANFPIKPAGLDGNQVLTLAYTDRRGLDLGDLAYLLLPPSFQVPVNDKKGGYLVTYAFQQYLFENTGESGAPEGWGVFGQISKMDGNPTPYEWSGFLGIGGNSPLPGRSLDRWGLVTFNTRFSNDLSDSFALLGANLGDERGSEAYYNLALTPWLRLAAHLQYLQPADHDKSRVMLAGTSLQIKF
ncbi:carbohydrate porin [Pseudomonas panipatensis]|uniref:Porin n=1 Tax=Pseudomonas panipatensis TaxID=428992 RepID=A0A1G8HAQ9_9PSED|nr:carbohydrate porin [Pseudomonas panipatensis]SDI03727.1 porin [Pseudomonas panipatensis]SMP57412.1 porin [Pseudomonas panipatensis]